MTNRGQRTKLGTANSGKRLIFICNSKTQNYDFNYAILSGKNHPVCTVAVSKYSETENLNH